MRKKRRRRQAHRDEGGEEGSGGSRPCEERSRVASPEKTRGGVAAAFAGGADPAGDNHGLMWCGPVLGRWGPHHTHLI
uniref:Uncharacterized protein n=1 Tax=Oryza brachyantha TaxID=4533 RepID=J3LD04_ORYBR